MTNIFTYGTLMFPELVYALTQKHFKSDDALIDNYIRYKVNTINGAEEYPVIVDKINHSVKGKLIYGIDDESLKIIDFYEGDEYKRIIKPIIVDGKTIEAFVYVWNSNERIFGNLYWDENDFKMNYLNLYKENIIPDIKEEYLRSIG